MSYRRGYGQNGTKYNTNVTVPQETHLQFTVTPTNGLGITSLKSNGYVRNVFMHTSTTPTAGDGYTNPNPASGYALIQFMNNFNYYLNGFTQIQPPATGSTQIDNAALTPGVAYIITTLGDASLATWQGVGLPVGVTPAVGVSFIATAAGGSGATSTSRVGTPTNSGIVGVELVGSPLTMLSTSNTTANGGAWLMLQFLGNSITGTIAAPTFTGTALGTHTHNFTVIGGQAGSTTNDIANYAGPLLGKQEATDATYLGANSATSGGVVAASAGTPAGTISAPAFTSTSTLAVTAPRTGSIICMRFMYDNSSTTIDGI